MAETKYVEVKSKPKTHKINVMKTRESEDPEVVFTLTHTGFMYDISLVAHLIEGGKKTIYYLMSKGHTNLFSCRIDCGSVYIEVPK